MAPCPSVIDLIRTGVPLKPGSYYALAVPLLFWAGTTAAQQLPSPQQVQQMLQNQPGLAEQARQRLMESGLSADQIRARLRAAGYPESLLDAYLGNGKTTGGAATPGLDTLQIIAIRALGLDTLGAV